MSEKLTAQEVKRIKPQSCRFTLMYISPSSYIFA